jgi:hypothetical protein
MRSSFLIDGSRIVQNARESDPRDLLLVYGAQGTPGRVSTTGPALHHIPFDVRQTLRQPRDPDEDAALHGRQEETGGFRWPARPIPTSNLFGLAGLVSPCPSSPLLTCVRLRSSSLEHAIRATEWRQSTRLELWSLFGPLSDCRYHAPFDVEGVCGPWRNFIDFRAGTSSFV